MDINNDFIFNACPFCGCADLQRIGTLIGKRAIPFSTHILNLENQRTLNKCLKCKSAVIQNSIPPSDAEKLYSSGDGTKRWSGIDFLNDKTTKVISVIQKYLAKGVRVCDVGCNTGEFLGYVKDAGAETFGVELSQESINVLMKNGHEVKEQLEQFPDEYFDILTAFDLIEHLYQPSQFLKVAYKKIKAGGRLMILTGNVNSVPALYTGSKWWYVNYPEHACFPSKVFFESLTDYEVEEYVGTYASKSHEESSRQIRYGIKRIFDPDYNGQPSFFNDHHFVVLRKQK